MCIVCTLFVTLDYPQQIIGKQHIMFYVTFNRFNSQVRCACNEYTVIFIFRFEETSINSGPCKDQNCFGGFSRLHNKVHELVNKRTNAIFLNAGDNFQGTIWYNAFRWNVTQHFMNMLPTDAYVSIYISLKWGSRDGEARKHTGKLSDGPVPFWPVKVATLCQKFLSICCSTTIRE